MSDDNADRAWEDADQKQRPVPLDRYVMAMSGTTRRVLIHDLTGITYEEVLKAAPGGTPLTEDVPLVTRHKEPLCRKIQLSTWRSFAGHGVLLPDAWTPDDPVPVHRFRAKTAEQARINKAAHEAWRAKVAADEAAREEAAKALQAHLDAQWADTEYTIISVQDDVIDQQHLDHYNNSPRAKNWLARCWSDRKAPGGFGREFLNRVPGNWPCCRCDHLRPGDYIEAGADEITYNGGRRPRRMYFRVLSRVGDLLVLRRCNTEPPPIEIEQLPLDKEAENLVAWLSTKDTAFAARFTAFTKTLDGTPPHG